MGKRGCSHHLTALLPVVLLVLSLLSCSSSNRLTDHIYYRLSSNPTTLDPAYIVDVTGGLISAKLFNGLVRLDEDLHVVPDIAEGWDVSRDRRRYTFRLRKGVTFSNGHVVTAEDFAYSFRRILDPRTLSPNTWVLEKIKGARDFSAGRADQVRGLRVINEQTLEITLEKPFAPFLYLLTMSAAYVVPEGVVNERGREFSAHPVGTGPFVLAEWLPNRSLRLERREDYFDRKSLVQGIVYRVIHEDMTAMTEFDLGNIDILTIPGSDFSRYRKDKRWKDLIGSIEGINTYYIGMNCSRPPFSNSALRRAVNMALDRQKLLMTFYEGRGRPAKGPVPDLLRRWNMEDRYPYDPDKARRMIEREGFKGAVVDFYITSDQEVVDMAEFIQSYLKKAGLDVRIRQLEWSAYKEAVSKGQADMFWLSWWADYPDAEDFLFPLFHSGNIGPMGNRARYVNGEVDRLIELGQAAGDERERNGHYREAERIIVEDAPWVFFWHKTDYTVRQPWVKNYRSYPVYSMDKGTVVALDRQMVTR